MNKEEIVANLQTMTFEEKLALLSDIDKAYLLGYLDRAVLDFRPRLLKPSLPKSAPQDRLKNGVSPDR